MLTGTLSGVSLFVNWILFLVVCVVENPSANRLTLYSSDVLCGPPLTTSTRTAKRDELLK